MLITMLLITGLFAQSEMTVIGGINYSTVAGDDVEGDVENLRGFRFGVQKNLENGLIGGLTYSQRGFSSSDKISDYDNSSGQMTLKTETEFKVNYLTAYVLKPIPMQTGIDFLVGGELGYFMSARSEWSTTYEDDDDYYSESGSENYDGDDWDDQDGNKLDFGLVFGGRYTINEQMSVVGTYYFGLAELFDDIEINNRSIQIGLSYALGGGGDSPDRASRSSSNSNRSSSKKVKSSESDSGECTPPSKAYGDGDVDNFLNNSYKVCQILSETTEQLNEVNDFVENPRMYIVKKANEATGPYREMLSGVREYASDPNAFINDAFAELSVEAENAFKDAQKQLAAEFEKKVTEFLVQQLMDALGLAKDGISGSGGALGGAKNLGFADKMSAIKDVNGALKNLKSAVDTIPKLQEELNRASQNIGKLLN